LGKVEPIKKEDLYRVHDKHHVDQIFALRRDNGFGNCDPRVPESRLWVAGSLLAASRHAMRYPAAPVLSPTSGHHHACWDEAAGFCPFNGLMVVAAILQEENPTFKMAILDLDQHEGDGTENIMKHRPDLNVLHFTSGQSFHGDNPQEESLDFQFWLKSAIDEINAYQPDLVIAQLAADPWVDDPLGGYLTIEQLIQRDQAVFTGIRAPLAWCLAGGYSRSPDNSIFEDPVLRIHRNTLIESDKSVKVRETFFKESS
jgi:acetoin utilization deacetylase AcuC-like enzyme